MTAEANQDAYDELENWVREATAILTVCGRLVEYNGDERCYEAWMQSSSNVRYWLSILATVGRSRDVENAQGQDQQQGAAFSCDAVLAAMLTPLLILIMEPEPDFLYVAMTALPRGHGERLRSFYARFLAEFADALCRVLWKEHPELAPPGWDPGRD
jgi:hypothetical protein